MQSSFTFFRIFFLLLCVMFTTTYAMSVMSNDEHYMVSAIGLFSGLAFGYTVINIEQFCKRFNLRSFNTVALGLFVGYLMGLVILSIVQIVITPIYDQLSAEVLSVMRTALFLFTSYLGLAMTYRTSEEFYISIPFVNLKPNSEHKKDLIIDQSVLVDPRFIDLATSGLLDSHLILPRYLVKELTDKSECTDEGERARARRSLETIKRLESITDLELRYSETQFSEITDSMKKNIALANLLNANIFIADANRLSQAKVEGIRLVNIHTLSTPFKPLAHLGENINIKVQRLGKDPRQGIGYLQDGTMVVINSGAEYIGETINAQILSVKHTSSGRIIFCNANDDQSNSEQMAAASLSNSGPDVDSLVKNYFAH